MMMRRMREERRGGEGLRQKSNNPNLKGGEKIANLDCKKIDVLTKSMVPGWIGRSGKVSV